MLVVVNKYFLARRFDGIVLWPFVFIRRRELQRNPVFMNHEYIHWRQQLEMLILLFFLWYLVEFLLRLLRHRDPMKAYRNMSFEREAYLNEGKLEYLKERPFWAFLKFL